MDLGKDWLHDPNDHAGAGPLGIVLILSEGVEGPMGLGMDLAQVQKTILGQPLLGIGLILGKRI